jgi:PAS domain S-box-containing protein
MIADTLGLSKGTVESYWNRMRLKLGAASRTEAVAIYADAEAGRLEQAHRRLTDELEQKSRDEEALRSANLELEACVRERTAELREANELLRKELAERKHAQEALACSETRLRVVIDTIPDLIWLKAPDGRYVECNPAFERFMGLPRDEIVGSESSEILNPFLRENAIEMDRAAAESGSRVVYDMVQQLPDGREMPFEVVKVPICGASGTLLGVVGVARDITQHRNAQSELRRERNLIQTIIGASPAYIVMTDAEFRILVVSDSLLRATGFDRSEVIARDFRDIWVPLCEHEGAAQLFSEVVEGRNVVRRRSTFLTKDCGNVLVDWTAGPYYEDGNIAGTVANGLPVAGENAPR